jgi:anti-sigma-K factor RskA
MGHRGDARCDDRVVDHPVESRGNWMRSSFWRRTAAVLALIIGVGVGASTAPASAQTTHSAHTGGTVQSADWWW